jgi:hypothetical protein
VAIQNRLLPGYEHAAQIDDLALNQIRHIVLIIARRAAHLPELGPVHRANRVDRRVLIVRLRDPQHGVRRSQ